MLNEGTLLYQHMDHSATFLEILSYDFLKQSILQTDRDDKYTSLIKWAI